MATNHSMIPLDDEQLGNGALLKFLEDAMVFFPETLPRGRFPTITELRRSINELGYRLEEAREWFVTSDEDFTEIEFVAENKHDDRPTEFGFRRGGLIVLNIAQALVNQCGSLLVVGGSPTVLLVPDDVFPTPSKAPPEDGFIATMSRRVPLMIKRLSDTSQREALFILSQIRQALRRADRLHHQEFFDIVRNGLSRYRRLLNHEDRTIRYLAFNLIASFPENFYEHSELLRRSIKNERDVDIKVRMLHAIEHILVPPPVGGDFDTPMMKAELTVLQELSDNALESPPVRLAAANLLARAWPGLLTAAMRSVFIDGLIQPEQYTPGWDWAYSTIERTLQSIEQLLLNHRIEVLLAALPKMTVAPYAHEALRALLDHVFFGAIRPTMMSSLPDTKIAERPEVNEACFRDEFSRDWLYPANPTKLTGAELLPTQRRVLETVIFLDIPWMVHSNLLEKYGLPPTRASIRTILGDRQ